MGSVDAWQLAKPSPLSIGRYLPVLYMYYAGDGLLLGPLDPTARFLAGGVVERVLEKLEGRGGRRSKPWKALQPPGKVRRALVALIVANSASPQGAGWRAPPA